MSRRITTHIVLTGPRAVGKSTLGTAVAASLGCPFIDLDDRVLESFESSSVKEVWERHGESAWREAEVRVLASVLDESPSVIALGGGVPTIQEAAELLNDARSRGTACVIWLKADPALLAERLVEDTGDRPTLTGQLPADEIASVCAQRAPAYESVSDHGLDVGGMDLSTAIQAIHDISNDSASP